MNCLVFTDTDLYSLTKGKAYLANHIWCRSTRLRDQCYDVGCHPCYTMVSPMKISVTDFSAPIAASVFKFCLHRQVGKLYCVN